MSSLKINYKETPISKAKEHIEFDMWAKKQIARMFGVPKRMLDEVKTKRVPRL